MFLLPNSRGSVSLGCGIVGLAGLISAMLFAAAFDSGRKFAAVHAAGQTAVSLAPSTGDSAVRPGDAGRGAHGAFAVNDALPETPQRTNQGNPLEAGGISGNQSLLAGGNAVSGQRIFFEKAEVFCFRCHAIKGQGGKVGPDLSNIGATKTREYLLEALLDPNRVIAEGYNTLLVQTIDGTLVFGVVRQDGPEQIRLVDVEAKEHAIPLEDIEERRPGLSAMPGDLQNSLTPDELRDLVEFLASLK